MTKITTFSVRGAKAVHGAAEHDNYRHQIALLEEKQKAHKEGSPRWEELEAEKHKWRKQISA